MIIMIIVMEHIITIVVVVVVVVILITIILTYYIYIYIYTHTLGDVPGLLHAARPSGPHGHRRMRAGLLYYIIIVYDVRLTYCLVVSIL